MSEKTRYTRKIIESDNDILFSVVTVGDQNYVLIPKDQLEVSPDTNDGMLILKLK